MRMKFCISVLFLTFGVAAAFAQHGAFGPITGHVKAGDIAPDLQFSNVVNAPGTPLWSPANLFGQLTVIGFFGDTSHNLSSVAAWNAIVAEFGPKQVQFVWMTNEKESSLLAFLAAHPIQGWVLLDPDSTSARAYGLETPEAVYIGADGKILGFDRRFKPEPEVIQEAVDRSVATNRAKPGEHLDAEAWRLPVPEDHRPNLAPSYDLHVSPSLTVGTSQSGGDDFLTLQGFDLKGALGTLDMLSSVRIDIAPSLDERKRYDFSMVVPTGEDEGKLRQIFREAVLDYFHASAVMETHSMDAYVLTAPDGVTQAARIDSGDHAAGGHAALFSAGLEARGKPLSLPSRASLDSLANLAMDGTTSDLCWVLETILDRPVVDETNWPGSFSVKVKASSRPEGGGNDFLEELREQVGLVISPAQRNVDILVVRPR